MKIDARGTSKFLSKSDVPQPVLATVDFVRIETLKNPTEDKPVLHFVGDTLKPLVLNVVNRKVLIAAYGDETDHWKGKPVEIYVNPDVTNSSGETVGGVRVRIPAAAPAPKAPPAPAPTSAAAPKAAPAPKPPPPTLQQQYTRALDGMNRAQDRDNLDQWARWANGIAFDERQRDALEDAYQHSLERIALAEAPNAAGRRG
jgi:hypothetical protein